MVFEFGNLGINSLDTGFWMLVVCFAISVI